MTAARNAKSSWNSLMPEEPGDDIRDAILGCKERRTRMAVHSVASYLWRNGFGEQCTKEYIWWSHFLRAVSGSFYRFMSWAAGESTWKEIIDRFKKQLKDLAAALYGKKGG